MDDASEVPAETAPEARAESGEEEGEEKVIFGADVAAVDLFEPDASTWFGGGALFAALNAVPGWLELELEVKPTFGPGAAEVPIDVFAKKPFRLSDAVHPFLGVGAGATFVTGEEARVEPNVEGVAGTYVWLGHHGGLVASVSGGAAFGAVVVPEVGLAGGPALKF